MKKARYEEIPVSSITVKDRVRSVEDDGLSVIRLSFQDHGEIHTPIHVRKLRNGEFELIYGAHRLTIAREFGLETIHARVWDCTAAQARFFETDANVSISHLTPVGLARSLVVRQEAYVKLHPETAAGVAGARAKHGLQTNNSSFAEFVGASMGVTPRQIQKILKAGKAVTPEQAAQLEKAPKRVSLSDLEELGKIGEADERSRVVELLALGSCKNAGEARRTYQSEIGKGPAPLNPTDQAFTRLTDAWARAPKAARDIFLEENGAEIQALLDAQEGGKK